MIDAIVSFFVTVSILWAAALGFVLLVLFVLTLIARFTRWGKL